MSSPIRPKPRPQAFGSALPRATSEALTSASGALVREHAAPRLFGAEEQEQIKRAAWGNVARGAAAPERAYDFGDLDLSVRFDWRGTVPDGLLGTVTSWGAEEAAPEDPFLHVTLTHYPAGGDPIVLHYSDIDRPVGQGADALQLDGRVLDLAYCARRLAPDGGIARLQTTLRLANHDAELNRLFRAPEFLRARVEIRVGFRSLPPAWYRHVGPLWRIDRLSAITPGHVELALIDATDALFGAMREPPTKAALREQLGITAPFDDENNQPHLPLGFGGEWIKAIALEPLSALGIPPLREKDSNGYKIRYRRRICLGASKSMAAAAGVSLAEVYAQNPANGPSWQLASMGENEKTRRLDLLIGPGVRFFPSSGTALIYPERVTAPNGETWFVAILDLNYTDNGEPFAALNQLVTLATAGRLWVRWPHGAEGPTETGDAPWAGKHDPASLIQHLARHYMGPDAHKLLHAGSFAATREAFGWAGDTRDAGGNYSAGDDGASTISAIGKSWKLDLWWGADGLLHVAPQYLTQQQLAEAAAGALVYDAQWDVLRGSWSETVPLGAERWGLANRFRYSGVREFVRVGWTEDLGIDEAEDLVARWGRVLEVDVSWAWVASALVYKNLHRASRLPTLPAERFTQRTVVTFQAPLHALELEPGDFLRVSHFAGSQLEGGYDRRLFRVEEVGLDWSGKRTKVVLADMLEEDRRRVAAFDKTSNWSRLRRDRFDGKHLVQLAAGSNVVRLSGPLFAGAGIKVGDLLLHDDDDAGVHLNLAITDASQLGTTGEVLVDEASPVTLSTGAFNVQRTRADPPNDAEFPGQYPLGAGHYFCACSSATGTFTDGSPGFRAEGR